MIQDQIHYNQKNWDKKIARLFCFFFFLQWLTHFSRRGREGKTFCRSFADFWMWKHASPPFLLPNFWPNVVGKKISKNSKNPKKYVLDIFVSFLAFSASSQKNLIFQRSFERVRLLTRRFLKSLIFLIELTLILLIFKKIQNTKK
jgi:hypothetical protein